MMNETEVRFEPAVQKPDPRMQQEQPAHRRGKPRQQQTDRHHGVDRGLARDVGALDEPCGR
jgi:hypothetical protein